jgi:hypothetical protein
MTRSTTRSQCCIGALALSLALLVAGGCRTTTYDTVPTLPSGRYLNHPPANIPPQLAVPVDSPVATLPPAPPPPSQPGVLVGGAAGYGAAKSAAVVTTDPYVAELLGILKETKSVDAFLVTLGLLVDAKPDHRQVVPSVIRNAERLGIYGKHAMNEQEGPEAEIVMLVGEAIKKLVHGEADPGCPKCVPQTSKGAPRLKASPQQPDYQLSVQPDRVTPILPPIPAGQRPLCDDPPDRAEILRLMSRVERGSPNIYEVWRDDVQFAVEKLVDSIDSPRFYPLIGPAQLHRCHWKCTVLYKETIEFAHPFPFACTRPQVEVIYIDRDRLYLATVKPPTVGTAIDNELTLRARSSDR